MLEVVYHSYIRLTVLICSTIARHSDNHILSHDYIHGEQSSMTSQVVVLVVESKVQ